MVLFIFFFFFFHFRIYINIQQKLSSSFTNPESLCSSPQFCFQGCQGIQSHSHMFRRSSGAHSLSECCVCSLMCKCAGRETWPLSHCPFQSCQPTSASHASVCVYDVRVLYCFCLHPELPAKQPIYVCLSVGMCQELLQMCLLACSGKSFVCMQK